jgi:hypothetical protein
MTSARWGGFFSMETRVAGLADLGFKTLKRLADAIGDLGDKAGERGKRGERAELRQCAILWRYNSRF